MILKSSDKSPFCLFMDRDGVINELLPGDYVKNISEFHFRENVLTGLAKLTQLTPYLFIITNQQGIGKGIMSETDLFLVHQYMSEQIIKYGGQLAGIYHCPHLESDDCPCRKPKTGMIEKIYFDFPEILDYPKLLIGDSATDLELGIKIGASCFGMRHGHNTLANWSGYESIEVHQFDEFVEHCIRLENGSTI
ncbi:MAG: HAD-IIIA family hydrolase [Saprospiraceae bacterium]|nr:HAD-IIIA family hydrolase [Saprospiraceae bacterium]